VIPTCNVGVMMDDPGWRCGGQSDAELTARDVSGRKQAKARAIGGGVKSGRGANSSGGGSNRFPTYHTKQCKSFVAMCDLIKDSSEKNARRDTT